MATQTLVFFVMLKQGEEVSEFFKRLDRERSEIDKCSSENCVIKF